MILTGMRFMEKKSKRNRKEWKWNRTIKDKYKKRKRIYYAEDTKRSRDSQRKERLLQGLE